MPASSACAASVRLTPLAALTLYPAIPHIVFEGPQGCRRRPVFEVRPQAACFTDSLHLERVRGSGVPRSGGCRRSARADTGEVEGRPLLDDVEAVAAEAKLELLPPLDDPAVEEADEEETDASQVEAEVEADVE